MPQISIVSIEIDVSGQKNKKSCKKHKKECIPIKRNTLFSYISKKDISLFHTSFQLEIKLFRLQ